MLKRENHLKEDAAFKKVFQSTRPCFTDNFIIRARRTSATDSRLGIVISGKKMKLAADRNFLRRRLYAAFGELMTGFAGSYDVVVVLKETPKQSLKEIDIAGQLKKGLERAGIIK